MITHADSAFVSRLHPSPNIEPRRGGLVPSILLLHYTGLATAEKAIEVLSRPDCKVSCHYVIDETGAITQMVAEDMRAWHAGLAVWAGESDVNSASIGIEVHNPGHDGGYPAFPDVQMAAVVALGRDILTRHPIPPHRVLAHSDVAPARKRDPGEHFDWRRLAAGGVGLWVEPAPVASCDSGMAPGVESPLVAEAQALLDDYGYGVPQHGVIDAETETVIRAFQRHFRPARVDGHLDRSTLVTLERLLAARAALPVS